MKIRKSNQIILIKGCCNQNHEWNGHYWENTVGDYPDEINKQLMSQGYRLIKRTTRATDKNVKTKEAL